MGRDAFAQIRKTDGSVPAAAVQPIYAEGGPGDSFHMRGLRFSPVAPTGAGRDGSPFVEATARGRAAMTLVDLSACTTVRGRLPSQWGEEAPADAGYQLRVSVERLVEFALEHGPLCARFPYARSLDGGELVEGEEFEESMGFWASAAIMADLAVAAQRCANGSLPLAAAQAALGNLVLWRVDNPRTGSSFDLFVISRTLDGAYTSWLGVPRFIRREEVEGRINYAFILGDADLDGVVEVALASFEHEITASDYRLLSQALDLAPSVDREVREVLSLEAAEVYSGVESDGYRLDDEKLRGCAGKLEKADLPQMASMVRALVTAHLGDAYVDVFSVSGATGHFSFRSYLSWLWYDFSCDLGPCASSIALAAAGRFRWWGIAVPRRITVAPFVATRPTTSAWLRGAMGCGTVFSTRARRWRSLHGSSIRARLLMRQPGARLRFCKDGRSSSTPLRTISRSMVGTRPCLCAAMPRGLTSLSS